MKISKLAKFELLCKGCQVKLLLMPFRDKKPYRGCQITSPRGFRRVCWTGKTAGGGPKIAVLL